VCFDDGGAAEAIVRDVSGHAVAPGDERAFANAVIDYIGNTEKLVAAGAGALANARRFGAEEHALHVARTFVTAK
jgi:glycosyltransferase involved in cell wall biosynthesis